MRLIFLLFSFLVFIPSKVFSMDLDTMDLENSITKILNSNHTRPFNGIILISQDNQIIYKKILGGFYQVRLESQFVIGSISKQFTATIILNLADKNLITLDKPIKNYLPELTDEWASQVTVKQLLNHTSGIIDLGKPLAFTPGSKFQYSPTLAYYLASCVAEHASGKSYEKLLQELFEKANMKKSAILSSAVMQNNYHNYPQLLKAFKEENSNIVEVIEIGENEVLYDKTWNPGGGIITTALDLVRWHVALHTGKLLTDANYLQMITPSAEREHPRYGKIGYGLGIQLLEKDGYLEISHSGYIDGYTSTVIYYPNTKLSVVILENISFNPDNIKRAFKIHDDIRDIIREYKAISRNRKIKH